MTTTEALLGMSREEFADLVDRDVRGKAPLELSQGLRATEVAERWYQQLVTMKKSAEAQLAAKSSEDRHQRITLLAAAEGAPEDQAKDMRRRAGQARAEFLRWRAGVLRFRAGVEERLSEASWRRRVAGSYRPVALLDERDQLLRWVQALTDAIRAHKASMADLDPDDIDEADETLWSVLGEVKASR